MFSTYQFTSEISSMIRARHEFAADRSNPSVTVSRAGPQDAWIKAWLGLVLDRWQPIRHGSGQPGGNVATTSAELQRTIAELRQELSERDAALAQRNTEFGERIEHQAATIDVLKAMSASPGDPQPVFDLIARQAAKLCNVPTAAVATFDGTMIHLATQSGFDAAYAHAYVSQFPRSVGLDSSMGRAILHRRVDQVEDITTDPGHSFAGVLGHWSVMAVPILRDRVPLGAITIGRPAMGPFSDSQVELLQTFAEQAVIAISSAETYRSLQTRTADLQESLEYQTATGDVLKVISRSTFDLQPVLDTVAQTAMRLCFADQAAIFRLKGDMVHLAVNHGFPPEYRAYWDELGPVAVGMPMVTALSRTIHERHSVHVHDVAAVPGYPDEATRLGRQRTTLGVPLLREGQTIGVTLLARQRVEPFTDRQIDLVRTFADQAVIAIENTRLLTEQQEALEQQTATAEVFQVINASPGNLQPVFDVILEKAMRLCEAAFGELHTFDGEHILPAALLGIPPAYAEFRMLTPPVYQPGTLAWRIREGANILHIADLMAEEIYQRGDPQRRAMVDLGGARSIVSMALRKDDSLRGVINIYRQEVRPFTDRQIALLQNFASQAVIAMENARLLNELRDRTDELVQRQAELRVTFENMGDGVAMFDETQHLVAWNRKFQDILDVPDDIIARRQTFSEYVRYLADRGEYGPEADPEEQVRRLIEQAGQSRTYERIRPDGRVIEIRHNPVAGGGFVLIYADITERKHNEAEIHAARDAAEEASRTIEAAFRDLKAAQANLIQAEKMASLGQLTAGIAHEIKNPLNFVNNFAALSVDLLSELKETAAPGFAALTDDQRADIDDVSAMLTSNLEKITEHGKRADGIVKAMLEHSRGSSAERRMVDLNVLIDEALNLAYHGARAQDQSFNITLERDFAEGIAPIEVNPQDMTRVFLNIFSNGFYAATRRAHNGADAGFIPTLKVTTRDAGEVVEIRVRDNGTGISAEIRDKLFQPFFTTKPTGEGTGLGLSITYDIVTKQHGGTITVDSEVNEFTEFVITLPRQMFAKGGRE
jgi:two-component system NtrC family sensor kinase